MLPLASHSALKKREKTLLRTVSTRIVACPCGRVPDLFHFSEQINSEAAQFSQLILGTRLQPPKKALPERRVCLTRLRITQAGWRIRLLWCVCSDLYPCEAPITLCGIFGPPSPSPQPAPFAQPGSDRCAFLRRFASPATPRTPQLQCRRTGTSRFSNTCETLFIFHSVLFQSSLAKVKLVDYTKRNNGIIL